MSPKLMSPKLKEAVQGLYKAFADVPKPQSINGCPCCVDERGISILLSKPLRELSPNEVTHYASSALLTVGAPGDFVYFLPRIFEILLSEDAWWPDPEVVMRAVYDSGFHSWPDSRRKAFMHLCDEVIDELLSREDSSNAMNSWICAFGRLDIDLSPFLNRIANHPTRLIEFYEQNSEPLMKRRLGNSFWSESPKRRDEVIAWFQSDEIQILINSQYGLR